jgi:hypothetical protein
MSAWLNFKYEIGSFSNKARILGTRKKQASDFKYVVYDNWKNCTYKTYRYRVKTGTNM